MSSSTWTTPASCGSAATVVPGSATVEPGVSKTARAGDAPTSAAATANSNVLPNAILMAPLLAPSRHEPIDPEVATAGPTGRRAML